MSKIDRQKYKIAGPATWELIRAAYLAGESAPALAERYGVGEYAIRKRITVEGWSKRDYAAALEARGMTARAKPPPPNFVEEGVLREQARQAAEAREAEARDAEIHAWIEKVAAEEEAFDIADALERRALAQAGAALVQGRSKDAQALASLAEQMRKHVRANAAPPPAGVRTVQPEEMIPREPSDAERSDFVAEMFGKAAYLAGCMVHAPAQAPAAFMRLIKEWRELNLGEGAADAEAAAARTAEAQAAYLNGDWIETMPQDVRERLQRRWVEHMAEMEAGSFPV